MKLLSSILTVLVFTFCVSQPAFSKSTTTKKIATEQATQQSVAINLNKADAKEIAKALKGVGLVKAQAIVEYRQQNGDFKAVEELASVKGIGVATIAKNHGIILLK